jgi:hypothetical protein
MPEQPPTSDADELSARVGGMAAGLLAGLVIGVVLGGVLVGAGSELAAGWVFFFCVATGTIVGYLSAAAGLGLAEGVAHFFLGVVHGVAERIPSPSKLTPRWLRWLFLAGVVLGLLVLVTRRW